MTLNEPTMIIITAANQTQPTISVVWLLVLLRAVLVALGVPVGRPYPRALQSSADRAGAIARR
jgi:hypothetical protein